MSFDKKIFPIRIIAYNAYSSQARVLCYVYDDYSFHSTMHALSLVFLHIVTWDSQGESAGTYDKA